MIRIMRLAPLTRSAMEFALILQPCLLMPVSNHFISRWAYLIDGSSTVDYSSIAGACNSEGDQISSNSSKALYYPASHWCTPVAALLTADRHARKRDTPSQSWSSHGLPCLSHSAKVLNGRLLVLSSSRSLPSHPKPLVDPSRPFAPRHTVEHRILPRPRDWRACGEEDEMQHHCRDSDGTKTR